MGTLKTIGYDYDEYRQALVKMVIIDELLFNFVEGKGFRLFSRTVQPRFDISSHFTIMRDCLKLYGEEKERLNRVLKGQRLCLTIDTWTSIQNINYMSLTAH
jgi:predicted cupin superfamily sugar epimerase